MEFRPSITSFALPASLLLLLTLLAVRLRQRQGRANTREALDTVTGWPPEAARVLTITERQAYDLLRRALPGFLVVANALGSIPNPLVNEAVTVTALAGITGSASGGLSIALAAMAETFISNANAAGIPMEVLHRIAAMASGGMDTLPHNGAVITLLAVTGLSHRQSYKDIFAITLIKTLTVFLVIAIYYATGWV